MPDFGNVIELKVESSYGPEDQYVQMAQDFIQAMAVRLATDDGVVDTAAERTAYERALVRMANDGQTPSVNIDYSINAEEARALTILEQMYAVGYFDNIHTKTPAQVQAIFDYGVNHPDITTSTDFSPEKIARIQHSYETLFQLYVDLDVAGKGTPWNLPAGLGYSGPNIFGVKKIDKDHDENPVIVFFDELVKVRAVPVVEYI